MKKKSDKMSDRYTNEITRLHHELTEKVVEKNALFDWKRDTWDANTQAERCLLTSKQTCDDLFNVVLFVSFPFTYNSTKVLPW